MSSHPHVPKGTQVSATKVIWALEQWMKEANPYYNHFQIDRFVGKLLVERQDRGVKRKHLELPRSEISQNNDEEVNGNVQHIGFRFQSQDDDHHGRGRCQSKRKSIQTETYSYFNGSAEALKLKIEIDESFAQFPLRQVQSISCVQTDLDTDEEVLSSATTTFTYMTRTNLDYLDRLNISCNPIVTFDNKKYRDVIVEGIMNLSWKMHSLKSLQLGGCDFGSCQISIILFSILPDHLQNLEVIHTCFQDIWNLPLPIVKMPNSRLHTISIAFPSVWYQYDKLVINPLKANGINAEKPIDVFLMGRVEELRAKNYCARFVEYFRAFPNLLDLHLREHDFRITKQYQLNDKEISKAMEMYQALNPLMRRFDKRGRFVNVTKPSENYNLEHLIVLRMILTPAKVWPMVLSQCSSITHRFKIIRKKNVKHLMVKKNVDAGLLYTVIRQNASLLFRKPADLAESQADSRIAVLEDES